MKPRVRKVRSRSARRKGHAGLVMMMSATVATGTLAVRPVEAAPQAPEARPPVSGPVQFAIAPGSLDVVLGEFERVTGLKTALAIPELGLIQSPGVTGRVTPADAMTALLQGTSVFATFGEGRADLAVDRVREFVEVSGRATPTVSSPRYTAPLRDIPQTIAVIPKAVIESQGATTLSDALRNVPGITLQAGEGGGASNTAGDMFNMRGFNASNSLFVDGVRDDGLIARDVFNLEQIEVFMGPTGSDVGRGTAAGYVNLRTKTPHMDPTYGASFSYGADDRSRLTTDFNWAPDGAGQGGWWPGHRAGGRIGRRHPDAHHPGGAVRAAGRCPRLRARPGTRACWRRRRCRPRPRWTRRTSTAASATTTTARNRTA